MPATVAHFRATQEVLVFVARAIDGLNLVIRPNGVDGSGVLINPRLKLAALKAARDHIDQVRHDLVTCDRCKCSVEEVSDDELCFACELSRHSSRISTKRLP